MLGPAISLNDESLKFNLRELVSKTVEDTPSELLEEEADDFASPGGRLPEAPCAPTAARWPRGPEVKETEGRGHVLGHPRHRVARFGREREGSRRHLDVTLLEVQVHRRAGLGTSRIVRKNLDGTGLFPIAHQQYQAK